MEAHLQCITPAEFELFKNEFWLMSSRLLLVEKFIKKTFGEQFLKHCVSEIEDEDGGPHTLKSDKQLDEIHLRLSPTLPEKFPMPKMHPIHTTVITNPNITITTTSSPGNTAGGAVIVNKSSKPIPPPPPLKNNATAKTSSSAANSNSSPTSTVMFKPAQRNFLPVHLTGSSSQPKPAATTSAGGNGIGNDVGFPNSSGKGIKTEYRYTIEEDAGSAHSSDSSGSSNRRVKLEPRRKRSPPIPLSKSSVRLSSGPALLKLSAAITPRRPIFAGRNNFRDVEISPVNAEYDSEDDQEQDQYQDQDFQDQDEYREDEYMSPDMVAANLSSTSSNTAKRVRLYNVPPLNSSVNGTNARQMRANPCHKRCQNRCHDIWTDGDRMGVFATYWGIPTEEGRRDWVATRIEMVQMATKRTEYSNFRTCTFKYYLPHPDNEWVQVCKNFFLATIDEKRSYIEKIAQSVKGNTDKLSTKNIPFRRRNQMRGGGGEVTDGGVEYVGWMTGGPAGDADAEGEEYNEEDVEEEEEAAE